MKSASEIQHACSVVCSTSRAAGENGTGVHRAATAGIGIVVGHLNMAAANGRHSTITSGVGRSATLRDPNAILVARRCWKLDGRELLKLILREGAANKNIVTGAFVAAALIALCINKASN